MHTEADSEFLQSARSVSAYLVDLSAVLRALNTASDDALFIEELTELLRALERLEQCLRARPIDPSAEAERTWTHDFRNQLNAVKGYAELSQEDELSERYQLSALLARILTLVADLNRQPHCQTQHAPIDEASTKTERPGHILIVEDNEENRLLLARILRAQGHTAIEAASAAEAFEQLQSHEVELILLDLILPDQNGFEILQQLKADPSLRSTSVIMISGLHEQEEAIRCIQAGAEDYLFKPVNQVMLNARIDASLERKSWRDREQKYLNDLARSHAFIRKTFGRYTSEEIVDRLLEDPHGLDLGGRQQQVSILMTDICGFTSLCNTLPPQEVVQLLNNYLGTLTEVIHSHHGTIDEFIGDAILAIFGAPFEAEDDADRAVQCAIAMQEAMRDVNIKNRRDGLPVIETSIAINSGLVVAGNIGSERRSKFAIVGQPVNLTARIEEVAGAGEILISDSTRCALSRPMQFGAPRTIRAKGFDESITVYPARATRPSAIAQGVTPDQTSLENHHA